MFCLSLFSFYQDWDWNHETLKMQLSHIIKGLLSGWLPSMFYKLIQTPSDIFTRMTDLKQIFNTFTLKADLYLISASNLQQMFRYNLMNRWIFDNCWIMQWLWLSWKSGWIWYQRSAVRIHIYILNIWLLSTVYWKDKNKEKEAGNGPFF